MGAPFLLMREYDNQREGPIYTYIYIYLSIYIYIRRKEEGRNSRRHARARTRKRPATGLRSSGPANGLAGMAVDLQVGQDEKKWVPRSCSAIPSGEVSPKLGSFLDFILCARLRQTSVSEPSGVGTLRRGPPHLGNLRFRSLPHGPPYWGLEPL